MTPLLDDMLQRRPYNAVTDFVDANVTRGFGDKVAFTDSARSLTYAQLQERTYRGGVEGTGPVRGKSPYLGVS